MASGIEQTDKMFYVGREVPWHGMGISVEKAPNSEEALKISGLDWNVIQKPVYVDGIAVENYNANVRDIDNRVLGIVTDRYEIVQNKDAFAFTDELIGLDYGVNYETAGSLYNGRRVWMLARIPEKIILKEKFDVFLVFSNTHDGTGAIKVAITPVRVVCQNTLNLALNNAKRTWSTKHVGNMEYKLEEAKRTLGFTEDYLEKFSNDAVVLANKIIDNAMLEQFIEDLFPMPDLKNATNRQVNNVEIMRNNFNICYNRDDLNEFKGTGWGVINAISDMATHSAPLRFTPSYKERLFAKTIDGNALIDEAYEILKAVA